MFILDTNVVSELRKPRGKADSNVFDWASKIAKDDLYLSAITMHELELGVSLRERRDTQQGRVLRTWLEEHVIPAFAGRILPVDVAVALLSARLHVPQTRPYRDGFIAGTALVHDMVVVTRNTSDLTATGARTINPWL